MDALNASALLEWWEGARIERDRFPWRSAGDPWHVLVSETMLVQTQADRVAQRYPLIVERFPTPAHLAAAPVGDLIALWAGLGYYRRAVALHRAAVRIVELHGGEVPEGLDDLLALPGVGAYTARAVLVFAFDAVAAPLDTNIRRVIVRALGLANGSPREIQRAADELVRRHIEEKRVCPTPRMWNLALMDLGSTVCMARSPRCPECPLRTSCAWRAGGGPDPNASNRRKSPRYEGSNREIRGSIVRALANGPKPSSEIAFSGAVAPGSARVSGVVAGLIAEGLVLEESGVLRLP
ncbi:MAG TPA: A/G-specific adenine glycosylase [Acidimicrobiales bacterium]|nr:A/G-specific adenine glycosylase [Acidimicrobiales bacterium]